MGAFIIPLSAAEGTDADQVGPKAANLAALARAGLPTPGGFCLSADAYRAQCAQLGLSDALNRFGALSQPEARRMSVDIRLKLYQEPIAPAVREPLLAAWREQREQSGPLGVVRSSALIEDRAGANFAGQFESFLGLDNETDFLTAVRACWAALWTSNARRYMDNNGLSPADTAMAVLIQPLVAAKASGGGLSETAQGQMLLSATWGLGSAIAQGEVVPDRISLSRQGFLRHIQPGRKDHRDTCGHGRGGGAMPQAVPKDLVSKACLDAGQAVTLGRMLRKAEDLLGMPVEIEWALDEAGFKLLQARPLHV
jgi:phosphoenolpyruvate synthase/pyruvate phosphate dikinase